MIQIKHPQKFKNGKNHMDNVGAKKSFIACRKKNNLKKILRFSNLPAIFKKRFF